MQSGYNPPSTIKEIIQQIEVLLLKRLSGQAFTRDERFQLNSLNLALKQKFSQVDIDWELNSASNQFNPDTLAYIHASRGNCGGAISQLRANKQTNIYSLIVGFIDHGDLNIAERLVQSGHLSAEELCKAYEFFGISTYTPTIRDAASIGAIIASLRNPNTDETARHAALDALRTTISKYAVSDETKLNLKFIELCRVYNNIHASREHGFLTSCMLKTDLPKIDPMCADILNGKMHYQPLVQTAATAQLKAN